MRIRVKLNRVANESDYRRAFREIKKEWLFQTSEAIRKFSINSMRKAPKRPKTKYGQTVNTTFKSGKKKGQPRTFFQKGRYSRPGHPPFRRVARGQGLSHQDFKVNLSSYSSKIGPVQYSGKKARIAIPELHEFGGMQVRVVRPQRRTLAKLKGNKSMLARAYRRQRVQKAKYPARPYMRPALEKGVSWFKRRAGKIAREAANRTILGPKRL